MTTADSPKTQTMIPKTVRLSNIADQVEAYHTCLDKAHPEEQASCRESVIALMQEMPHMDGIESGLRLNWDHSSKTKLIFNFSFRHEDGTITQHQLTVTPLFGAFALQIGGANYNHVKDSLYDFFYSAFH